MYPKKACVDAVSRSETERKSGVKQIGLVGARAVCGSDSRSAVSRGNQTGLCGSLFRQSTQQQRALATWPFTGSLPWPSLAWIQAEQPVNWKSYGFTALWIYFKTNSWHVVFCFHEKKNENGKLLIFKLNSGSEWEPLSLPTHIADVNMSFVTESLDANIWTVIEERGRVLKGPLFVLLAEYKVLRGDPIARLPVDLQSTGSSSTQAPQTSSQPLHCNHLTFQLKRKLRKKETCSEARSPSTLCFFFYRTQC